MKTTLRNHWDYYPHVIVEEIDTDDFIINHNQKLFEYCEKYFWECIEKKEPYCYGRNLAWNPEWDKRAWKPPKKFLDDFTKCFLMKTPSGNLNGLWTINIYEVL